MGNAVMSLFELQAGREHEPALVYRRELMATDTASKWSRRVANNNNYTDTPKRVDNNVNDPGIDKKIMAGNSGSRLSRCSLVLANKVKKGSESELGDDSSTAVVVVGQRKNKHQVRVGEWPAERGSAGHAVRAPHESLMRAAAVPATPARSSPALNGRSGTLVASAGGAPSGIGNRHTHQNGNRSTGSASQPRDQNNIAAADAVGQNSITSPINYHVGGYPNNNKTPTCKINNHQQQQQHQDQRRQTNQQTRARAMNATTSNPNQSVDQLTSRHQHQFLKLVQRPKASQLISDNQHHDKDRKSILLIATVGHKAASDCNNNDNNNNISKQTKQQKKLQQQQQQQEQQLGQKKTRRKQKQQQPARDPQAPTTKQISVDSLDLSVQEPSKRSAGRASRKQANTKPAAHQLTCQGDSLQQQQVGQSMKPFTRRPNYHSQPQIHHPNFIISHNQNYAHFFVQPQHNPQHSPIIHYTNNQQSQPVSSYPPPPPPRPWLQQQQQRNHQHAINSTAPNCSTDQFARDSEFTVISYNVLCDRMVSNKMFPSSPDIALDWSYRRKLILRELLTFDADIIALQELEMEQFESCFMPELERYGHYGAIFEPKSRARTMDPERRKRVDGCAIFYKRSKFRLVQKHLLEFNQMAMANAQGSEAMLNRVMTKDNIGLVAVLELVSPFEPRPRRILVCNTHIHWDPECCDVKLIQTIMLMNELKSLARYYAKVGLNMDPECQALGRVVAGDGRPLANTRLQPIQPQQTSRSNIRYSPFHGFEDDDSLLTATSSSSPSSSSASSIIDGDCKDLDENNNFGDQMLPLVLLGDFNSTPTSGVTSFLTNGKITSLHQDFKDYRYSDCQNALALLGLRFQQESTGGDVNQSMGVPHEGYLIDRRLSSPAWHYASYLSAPATKESYSQRRACGAARGSPLPATASTITSNSSSCASSYSSSSLSPRSQSPQVLCYQHPFNLISAYQRDTMPYTNYTTNFKAVIDYIFYSGDSIQLLGLLGPLNKNWLKDNQIHGLPQPHLPSDHLPLLVRLRLTTNQPSNPSNKRAINV